MVKRIKRKESKKVVPAQDAPPSDPIVQKKIRNAYETVNKL